MSHRRWFLIPVLLLVVLAGLFFARRHRDEARDPAPVAPPSARPAGPETAPPPAASRADAGVRPAAGAAGTAPAARAAEPEHGSEDLKTCILGFVRQSLHSVLPKTARLTGEQEKTLVERLSARPEAFEKLRAAERAARADPASGTARSRLSDAQGDARLAVDLQLFPVLNENQLAYALNQDPGLAYRTIPDAHPGEYWVNTELIRLDRVPAVLARVDRVISVLESRGEGIPPSLARLRDDLRERAQKKSDGKGSRD